MSAKTLNDRWRSVSLSEELMRRIAGGDRDAFAELQGGRSHRLGGRPSALFVYRGPGAKTAGVSDVRRWSGAARPGRRGPRPPRFPLPDISPAPITLVFWQEDEVVCVLAGDFGEEEIVALAFEKAML